MVNATISRIPAQHTRSLVWEGQTLVDWAAGGTRMQLDGSIIPPRVRYAYRFDAACGSPSGNFAVLFEHLGTKGLVLHRGKVLREINRSFYHADVYEYPIVITQLADGREVLVHCPDEYNQLEMDEVETGHRLTASKERKPCDFFHSRLAACGELLLSAGWMWHPVDVVGVYSLATALSEPTLFDELTLHPRQSMGVSSAVFLDSHRLIFASSDETFCENNEPDRLDVLRPNALAVWELVDKRFLSQVTVPEPVGSMMALSSRFVLGVYEHPKVFDLNSGEIVWRLPDVNTGKQASSIIHHLESIPPIAMDPVNSRLAVATESDVVVVSFHCDQLR